MTLRRLLFWMHLAAGIAVGVVILFLACTGAMMAFQSQVISWAERDARVQPSQMERLSASALMTAASRTEQNATPTNVALFVDPSRPAEITFAVNHVLLLDPYTGRLVRTDAGRLRGFFVTVRDLHRWLALKGVWRERAREVKASVCMIFLFQIMSGLVLWVPRLRASENLLAGFRARAWIRPSLRKRALEWNVHNAIGIWFALPILAILVSGLIMAFPWANALLFRAAGTAPPAAVSRNAAADDDAASKARRLMGATTWSEFDPLVARASQQDSKWKSLSFRVPADNDASVVFMLDENGNQPQVHARLTLDRKTGEIIRWEPFESNSRGRRWRMDVRYLHTGEIFGLAGEAIAFLSCLAVIAMVWTGAALALRRWLAWRKGAAKATSTSEAIQRA